MANLRYSFDRDRTIRPLSRLQVVHRLAGIGLHVLNPLLACALVNRRSQREAAGCGAPNACHGLPSGAGFHTHTVAAQSRCGIGRMSCAGAMSKLTVNAGLRRRAFVLFSWASAPRLRRRWGRRCSMWTVMRAKAATAPCGGRALASKSFQRSAMGDCASSLFLLTLWRGAREDACMPRCRRSFFARRLT